MVKEGEMTNEATMKIDRRILAVGAMSPSVQSAMHGTRSAVDNARMRNMT